MVESLITLTNDLKKWKKSVYDHITTRKRNLVHKLSMVQEQIDRSSNNFLASHEMDLR